MNNADVQNQMKLLEMRLPLFQFNKPKGLPMEMLRIVRAKQAHSPTVSFAVGVDASGPAACFVRWGDLKGDSAEKIDREVRVGLFSFDPLRWENTRSTKGAPYRAILIDIDGAEDPSPGELEAVAAWAKRKLKFAAKVIFTGHGFHIVVPIMQSFAGERWKATFRAHHRAFLDEVEADLKKLLGKNHPGIKADRQVMASPPYTRMPGTANLKREHPRTVKLVTDVHGPPLEFVDQFYSILGVPWEKAAPETPKAPGGEKFPKAPGGEKFPKAPGGGEFPKAPEFSPERNIERYRIQQLLDHTDSTWKKGHASKSKLLQNCAFVDSVDRNVEGAPTEHWTVAMQILGTRGEQRLIERWEEQWDKARKGDNNPAANFTRPNAPPYSVGCKRIRDELRFEGCLTCPLNGIDGMSPVAITGAHPTPAVTTQLRKRVQDKESGGFKAGQLIDTWSFANLVINHLGDGLLKEEGAEKPALFIWNGQHFEPGAANLSKAVTWGKKLRDKIKNLLPARTSMTEYSRDVVGRELASHPGLRQENVIASDENFVTFNNGVLDLRTLNFRKNFSPKIFTTYKIDHDFEPNHPDAGKVRAILSKMFPDERALELVEAFAGLTLTALPGASRQEMLWICGMTGRGKSTLAHMLLQGMNADAVTTDKPYLRNHGAYDVRMKNSRLHLLDDIKISTYPHRAGGEEANKNWSFESFESFVKDFTGTTKIQVKSMAKQPVNAVPATTLVALTNELPFKLTQNHPLFRRIRVAVAQTKMSPQELEEYQAHATRPEWAVAVMRWKIECLRKALDRKRARKTEANPYTPPRTGTETSVLSPPGQKIKSCAGFLKAFYKKDPEGGWMYLGDIRRHYNQCIQNYEVQEPASTLILSLLEFLGEPFDRAFDGVKGRRTVLGIMRRPPEIPEAPEGRDA